jgi:hypothetical protein
MMAHNLGEVLLARNRSTMTRSKNKSKKGTTAPSSSSNVSKVSATEESEAQNNHNYSSADSNDEVWDIIKKIASPCDSIQCRMDDCPRSAVAIWASSLNPDDTWPICEECQATEFGGWPEEEKISSSESTTSVIVTEDEDDKQGENLDEIEHNEMHQCVDLVTDVDSSVIESESITSVAAEVSDGGCDLKDDEATGSSLREVIEETEEDNADHPLSMDPINEESDNMDLDKENSSSTKQPSDDDSDQSDAEVWDLVKVMTPNDLESPIKCSTETCVLPAACVYKSILNPSVWYTCLDCQVSTICLYVCAKIPT